MRPTRVIGSACALVLLAAATPAQAAWNNVFQVCCASCNKAPVAAAAPATSFYGAAPAPSACCAPPVTCCAPPPPVCTTRYVQRCFYQPVTCYQTKSYYEQVTTYRTSYYYEPVTTYRYSCYYDPCTCSYRQQACPVTSYRLRSQCCPVNNWVQRCCQVPVTSYRIASYWEPQTTCCQPAAPCCPTAYASPAPVAPPQPQPQFQPQPQPAVTEQRPMAPMAPPPAVQEVPGNNANPSVPNPNASPYDRYYPPNNPPTNRLPSSGSSRPIAPPASTPPAVRLDKIVSLPSAGVEGQVVNGHNVRLMFVSLEAQGDRHQVQAGNDGRFQVKLASGGWLVYVQGADNKPVFHSKIDVRDNETRQMTLVSR